jgi:hypothetical protein
LKPRIPTPKPGKWHSTTGHYDRNEEKEKVREEINGSQSELKEENQEEKESSGEGV